MSVGDAHLRDEAGLRRVNAEPAKAVRDKSFPHFDRHSRRHIELCPFFCTGSSRPDGPADVSSRGGEPGFVRALDGRRAAFADLPGNNGLDALSNVVHQPAAGMLFFSQGVEDMLRVNGVAFITTDPETIERSRHEDKLPCSVIVIETREVDLHCSKAVHRSNLWNPDKRLPKGMFPTLVSLLATNPSSWCRQV